MPAKVVHYSQVQADPIPDLEGVTVRWVIGKDDGAPHFAMRVFEVQPGRASPHHRHWWEHEVFVLNGQGVLRTEEGDELLQPGIVAFVPKGLLHQFYNSGVEVLRFLCLIPHPELEGWAQDNRTDVPAPTTHSKKQ